MKDTSSHSTCFPLLFPDGCFVEEGNNCGNMLLDPGEECYCGSASNILDSGVCRDNVCCFGRNCTLNSNVQCR